jgi:hypothetical protein
MDPMDTLASFLVTALQFGGDGVRKIEDRWRSVLNFRIHPIQKTITQGAVLLY